MKKIQLHIGLNCAVNIADDCRISLGKFLEQRAEIKQQVQNSCTHCYSMTSYCIAQETMILNGMPLGWGLDSNILCVCGVCIFY